MLENTEERVVPQYVSPKNGMLLEHYARYHFAVPYAKGRVLDIATGAGYGPQILLQNNANIDEVVAVDIAEDALQYAKEQYDHPKINWKKANGTDPKIVQALGQFDTIVSFETIEHMEQDFQFMEHLYQMLKPGGTAIISTPFGKGRGEPCADPYHVCQYTAKEFEELVHRFEDVTLFYQVNETIEISVPEKTYYLQLAVCRKRSRR